MFEFACAQDSNLGKVGAEHDVAIIQDRFSKVIQAYPSVSRDAAQVASSFKHFVALRSSEFTMVKSDAAGEILKAVVEQGWLSEASVPSRFLRIYTWNMKFDHFKKLLGHLFCRLVLLRVHSYGLKLAAMW